MTAPTLKDRAKLLAFKAMIKHRQIVDRLDKSSDLRVKIAGAILAGKSPEEIQKIVAAHEVK